MELSNIFFLPGIESVYDIYIEGGEDGELGSWVGVILEGRGRGKGEGSAWVWDGGGGWVDLLFCKG